MNDVYETPKSELGDAKLNQTLVGINKLKKDERLIASVALAFFVSLGVIYLLTLENSRALALVFLTPGIAAGIVVKLTCRLIFLRKRLIASLGTLSAFLISFPLAPGLGILVASLSILNAIIFVVITRRPLNMDQEKILSRYLLHKVKET